MNIFKEIFINFYCQKIIIRKNIYSKTLFLPFIFLLISILSLLIYTTFYPIITESHGSSIGIGSRLLNLGDRNFYLPIDEYYGDIKASFLFPFILNFLKKFVSFWGYDEYSKLWNLSVISISSLLSIVSLFLIYDIAWELFGKRVATIASWLYVICPYTLYFAISGSITHYVLLGTNLSFWIVLKGKIFFRREFRNNKKNIFKYLIMLGLCCFYLASLRPSGAIYSITLLSLSLIFLIYNYRSTGYKLILAYSFLISILFYSFYQLHLTSLYIGFTIDSFMKEPGYFFGVKRDILRERLVFETSFNLYFLKNIILNFMWKISDFISGINDIRDTHTEFNSALNNPPLFPFLIRVFSGLFYFFPLNICSLLGMIKFRKLVFRSGLWILLICILVTLSPSLLGVASNRYLYMLFTPFIVFSSSIFSEILFDQK